MKKIAMLTGTINGHGGIQRVIVNLTNELIKNGHSVDIIVTHQKEDEIMYNLNKLCKVKKIYIGNGNYIDNIKKSIAYFVPKLTNDEVKYNLIFSKFIKSNLENTLKEYDTVIAHAADYSALISKLNIKAKKIGVQHSTFDIYCNNYFKRCMTSYIEHMKNLSYNVVLSDIDVQKYKNVGIKNTIKIPNLIEDKKVDRNHNNRENKIISVGRMVESEVKGFDLLIESFSKIQHKCKDWKVVIYGDGPMKNKYENMVKDHGLEGRIILPGFSDNIEGELYKSKIFAMSSRWEGFGMVVAEAMQCELPIICFDIDGGVTELVKHNKNGIIVPKYNIDEFGKSLLKLVNNEDLINKYGLNSKVSIKKFSPENIIIEWLKII